MELATYVDSLWIVVAGILVMFMQPGFMLVETGFTRSKNSVNIVMKNFMMNLKKEFLKVLNLNL